jgi:hypothetical protein
MILTTWLHTEWGNPTHKVRGQGRGQFCTTTQKESREIDRDSGSEAESIQAYGEEMSRGQIGMQEILEAREQLTADVERAEQRAQDKEAEDATIWVLLGVGSEEVDNEVTWSGGITLPLRRTCDCEGCE